MSNGPTTALVTPSYAGDFERCRLLCDSVDRFVEGDVDHFILVDNDDYNLFSELSGSKRHVINELDILPNWLRSMRPGPEKYFRKIWWSTRTWPMRGWHVQQLRRIAIAKHISHCGMLYCDSDMLFVRPFSPASLWCGDNLRLYRKPYGIAGPLTEYGSHHRTWTEGAANLHGLAEPAFPAHDYINNLVSWRRDYVLEMCDQIEQVAGKDWVAAIGASRTFSECQIYGAYADNVKYGAGVWHAEFGLCETYWSGDALTQATMTDFVDGMASDQVAVGIQSFTGTDPAILRQLLSG